MARLEYLGEKKWKGYFEVGSPGDRHRRTRRIKGEPPTDAGNAPRAVLAKAREIEQELAQQRLHLAPGKVTFQQAADAWWEWWTTTQTRSPNTVTTYRSTLDRVLTDLGPRAVEQLTPAQLTTYYAKLRGRGLLPNTVRNYHQRVQAVLKYAVHSSWATRNAAGESRRPSEPSTDLRLLTLPQIEELVAEALRQSPMAARGLAVAFGTGMRRGELTALRRSKLQQDRDGQPVVMVDSSMTDRRTGNQVKDTKTHQARRVPLRPWVEATLLEQMAEQEARAREWNVALVPDAWLWSLAPDGSVPVDPGYFSLVFTRAEDARRCRLVACPACGAVVGQRCVKPGKTYWHPARKEVAEERFSLHDLRHAFASWLLAEGVPVTEVARLLGHANPATTLKIYAKSNPTGQGAWDAIAKLPELVRRVRLELTPAAGDN